ncbi:MAG: hypothetical protein AAGA54_26225 [Myxococcota bacterium]
MRTPLLATVALFASTACDGSPGASPGAGDTEPFDTTGTTAAGEGPGTTENVDTSGVATTGPNATSSTTSLGSTDADGSTDTGTLDESSTGSESSSSSGGSTTGASEDCVPVPLAWSETTALPIALGQGDRAGMLDGRLYVAGGVASKPGSLASDLVYAADIGEDGELSTWEPQAALPLPGAAQQLVVAGGNLYGVGIPDASLAVFGFPTGQIVWRANIEDGDITAWVLDPALFPFPFVSGFSTFGTEDHLYVVGGSSLTGGAPSSSVTYAQVYDDGTLSPFIGGEQLPSPLVGAGAAVLDGEALLVAGVDPTEGATGTESYAASLQADGNPDTWAAATVLPQAQFSPSVVRAGDRVLALGGFYVDQVTQQITGVADQAFSTLDGVSWLEETALPAPRNAGSAVANDEFVFLVGGAAGQLPDTIDTASVLVSRHCDVTP